MSIEQIVFLNFLSDHLNRRKSKLSSKDVDWNQILYFAQIQQVEGIVYYQSKDYAPVEIKKYLEEKYGLSLTNYANQEYYLKKLLSRLSADNIECFIVKGILVAAYYPLPQLRTMGDSDIVVHSEDRHKVHKILLEQGYINESCNEGREWIYYKDKYEIELHDGLIYNETINRKSHEEFFSNYWDYVRDGVLDWNYHFIYLILHLRKHLMNCGVGFRQFMDIAIVMNSNRHLDWNWIEKQLVNLDLIEFSRVVFALNEAWFGVNSPINSKAIDESFFELVTEQVFNNGVFGFDNEMNKDNLAVNNARKGMNAKFSMVAYAVRKVFPSYKEMVSVPKYRFIKGKKWLLPAAWIYRIFKGNDKSRFSHGVNSVKSSFVSKETIAKREEYLKQWGLYEAD